jgi:UDP-N-acetylmuramyl pentapeptide phosphotransferase/UDP-N-acetylglucosamine-1-phosphate transferase
VAASAGGFLVFNWQPARVFMGDVGSAFLGMLLASLPLLFPAASRGVVLLPIAMALWPYIYDPLVSVIRRLWNRQSPFEPHREFLFHRLVRSGVSHARVTLLYGLLSAVGGLLGLALVRGIVPEGAVPAVPAAVVLMAVLLTAGIEIRCFRHPLAAAGGSPHAPR